MLNNFLATKKRANENRLTKSSVLYPLTVRSEPVLSIKSLRTYFKLISPFLYQFTKFKKFKTNRFL